MDATITRGIVELLQDCLKKRDLVKGIRVHAEIVQNGLLETCSSVTGFLVSMYAKCGALARAQQVLLGLPVRDLTSWNGLIVGYAQHGQGEEAIKCFQWMQQDGHFPDAVTFTCVLKACGDVRDSDKGEQIHDDVARQGLLAKNICVGNSLVGMYAKCGALKKARQVLDGLAIRDALTWNALIRGYTQHRQGHEALNCFDRMKQEGHPPNAATFISVLKACSISGAIGKGQQIHEEIVKHGLLEKNSSLGTALLDMYAKCGALSKAREVLFQFPVQNVITWNALISGYVQQGQDEEALRCLERMEQKGPCPSSVTYLCALKACANLRLVDKGEQIHLEVVRQGLLNESLELGNALVDMYARFGFLRKARHVLDELPVRDLVSWNTLIAGYSQQGQGDEALKCFDWMQSEGLFPDAVTFTCLLKACGSIKSIEKGKQIHDEVLDKGLLKDNIVLGTALLDMYARCGALVAARQVFNELRVRNVVSWNALLTGYLKHGQCEEALNCLKGMQKEGFSPDAGTLVCMLKACATVGAAEKGEIIHNEVVRKGWLKKDMMVGTALLDMLAKYGEIVRAHRVFDELPVRDSIAWNTLIMGYVCQGQCKEALNCFEQMWHEGHSPDKESLTGILKACAAIGAADKGEQIHEEAVRQDWLQKDILLATAVLDMYVKCGLLSKARQLVQTLSFRNVISWNVVIAGYSQRGHCGEVLNCFEWMQQEGILPDWGTLNCVLNACSHAGLLYEGQLYFMEISSKYCITPDAEHYCCMVDLFGRAGKFHLALAVTEKMPFCDNLPIWHALLSACWKWENVKVGRLAFEHSIEINKDNAAQYICMSNIYTTADMKEEACKIEAIRVTNEARVDASGFPDYSSDTDESIDIYEEIVCELL